MTAPHSSSGPVGQRLPKVDAVDKATGAARFTVDIKLPNMLHGRLLRSPHPHARILDVDASRALKLPGMRAVLTHRDVPQVSARRAAATACRLVYTRSVHPR